MKVYELAKELNIKSVHLVDRLRRDCRITVKNHMAVMTEEQIQKARRFLSPSKKPKPAIKKARTKKTLVKKTPTTPLISSVKKNIIRRKASDFSSTQTKDSKPSTLSDKQSAEPHKNGASPTPRAETEPLKAGSVFKSLDGFAESFEEDKKKPKKITIEKENQGKQFRAADFRKREVIFQPKKKRSGLGLSAKKTKLTQAKAHKRVIKMNEYISVESLAHQMGVKLKALKNRVKKENLLEELPESVDYETAVLLAGLFNFEVKNLFKKESNVMESLAFGNLSAEKKVKAPVVTVMGHVNHGKTTLLDAIRKSRVAQGEAGGITQHIGAYSVPVGKSFVTFIDTPGHSAFANMRVRGAQVTDIVVLVTAADDGVQEQTLEALNHAKNAKVPIIVAINKIDSAGAKPDQVKKSLSEHNLLPEEWGGDTVYCSVSALKGEGLKELLEHIQLLAEVQELKANPERSAIGCVMESYLQKGLGWVMNLIVQDGTLKAGSVVLAGSQAGRIRQMKNDKGELISSAGPGCPVEVSGLPGPVSAGELFYAVKDISIARRFLAEKEQNQKPIEEKKLSVEELLEKTHLSTQKQLNIVLKTDGFGSQEALLESIKNMSTKEVEAKILHKAVGAVSENDVLLASAGEALILGFNVSLEPKAQKIIQQKGIFFKNYEVIYELLEGLEKMMAGRLDPEIQEQEGGKAEILKVFQVSRTGAVAGCRVTEGKINNKHLLRLKREGKCIHEGRLSSLKRFKEEVKSANAGQECGIVIHQYTDIQPGDIIETFSQISIKKEKL